MKYHTVWPISIFFVELNVLYHTVTVYLCSLSAKDQWQTERRLDTEREIQSRLMKAKDTWRATELTDAITKAQSEHRENQPSNESAQDRPVTGGEVISEELIAQRLQEARDTWRNTELPEAIEKVKREFKLNNEV